MKIKFILFVCLLAVFASCKKDTTNNAAVPAPTYYPLSFKINYDVDGQPLLMDSMMYFNAAGNHYEVINLQYFISQIALIREDGTKMQVLDYQYLDAAVASTNTFTAKNIPAGNYTGLYFNIGIDSAHNVPGGLPNETNNNNMAWPELMGGGYHVMKLEGYFADGNDRPGFAMHIGTNNCLVKVELHHPITIKENAPAISLSMNLNEWFCNPSTYDFNTDGNYTMGNMMLMLKLAENGKDVFHF